MRTVRLGEVATIERRGVDPTTVPDDTVYLGLEHIERGGKILASSTVAESGVTSTKFRFGPHHLLFGKLRPNLAKVSRPTISGICSTDFLPVLPGSHLDRGFLAWYLLQPSMVDFAATRTAGANLPRLSPTVLADFPVPLPPLDEQRRIAAILDAADAIRIKRRQVLAHLDTLTQSVFHSMFGRLDASSTVSEVSSRIRTGPFGSQLLHSEFVDSGITVLGLDNVVGNQFQWSERRFVTEAKYLELRRYTVAPRDVLISIMGTVGRCVVVPADIPLAINTKHICAISPDRTKMDSEFLRGAFLWHPDARRHLMRQTKGSIMDGLNMGIIKSTPVPLPPVENQRAFAAKSAVINSQRLAVERTLAADEELFASLQSRAFRGEL